MTLAEELLDSTVETYTGAEVDPDERDFDAMKQAVGEIFGVDPVDLDGVDLDGCARGNHRRAVGADPAEVRDEGSAGPAATSCAASSATSCCRLSTRSGRITSTASTT